MKRLIVMGVMVFIINFSIFIGPGHILAQLNLFEKHHFLLIAFSASDKEMLERAKTLYEQKNYIASVDILEKIKDKSAEVIYWIWKNEKEIGTLADLPSRKETDPNHKYYLYVNKHQEYFYYYEPDGNYQPRYKRYQEISSLFPDSDYAGSIFYELIEYDQLYYFEGGEEALNADERVRLISKYQRFLNKYPDHPRTHEARKQIKQLEELGDVRDLGSYFIIFYGDNFVVSWERYEGYLKEWMKAGRYREYGIEVIPSKIIMKKVLPGLNIPEDSKKTIEGLIEKGKLIIISEAAFKNKDWQGPKFLVFEPKKSKEAK